MFVDMTYQFSENKDYYGYTNNPNFNWNNLKPKKRKQLMIGNELYQNNVKTWERKGIPLEEGLYYTSYISPKPKQINRVYTQKPKCIKK